MSVWRYRTLFCGPDQPALIQRKAETLGGWICLTAKCAVSLLKGERWQSNRILGRDHRIDRRNIKIIRILQWRNRGRSRCQDPNACNCVFFLRFLQADLRDWQRHYARQIGSLGFLTRIERCKLKLRLKHHRLVAFNLGFIKIRRSQNNAFGVFAEEP